MSDEDWDNIPDIRPANYDPRPLITPFSPGVVALANELKTAEAAFIYTRDNITYHEDDGEVWRTADDTIAFQMGDCDDKAILLVSLLRNMGYESFVRVSRLPPGGHAYVVWKPEGVEQNLDPTLESQQYVEGVEYNERVVADFNDNFIKVYNPTLWRKIVTA